MRDDLEGLGERHINRMDTLSFHDPNRAGKRRGDGRNEDRESAIIKRFNDESRNESPVVGVYQCGLPDILPSQKGVSMGELIRSACEQQYGILSRDGRISAARALSMLSLPVASPRKMKNDSGRFKRPHVRGRSEPSA